MDDVLTVAERRFFARIRSAVSVLRASVTPIPGDVASVPMNFIAAGFVLISPCSALTLVPVPDHVAGGVRVVKV